MPAVSKRQQRFMGAELARKRAGKGTRTGMSQSQLEDFAGTPQAGLPERVGHSIPTAREELTRPQRTITRSTGQYGGQPQIGARVARPTGRSRGGQFGPQRTTRTSTERGGY